MDNQLTIKQVLDLLNGDIADINADITDIANEFTKIFVFANAVSGFPLTGDTNHLYIDTTSNVVYYWNVENNSYQSTKGADDIPLADATHNGLFSSIDFVKLSNIAEGATKVQSSNNNGYIVINGTDTPVFDYTEIPDASVTTKGLMTPAQSAKLIGISDEATKVQNSTTKGNIVIDGTEVNVFSVSDIPDATTTSAGLMTALNVAKLDGVAPNATKTEGSKINGNIIINGIETPVYTAGGGDVPLASATEDGLQSKENFVKQGTVATGATKTEKSNVNGNIRINDTEVKVFDPTQLPLADADNNGLMTSASYTKLVDIAPSATNTTGSDTVGNIVVNGTETKVFNVSDIPSASKTVAGLMPTTAVTKLEGITENATNVEASATNGNIVIDGTETTVFDVEQIPNASTTENGFMTSSMVTKLDGIASGATNVEKSDINGNIIINEVETNVFDTTQIPDASATVKGYFTPSGFNKLAGIASGATVTAKSETNGNIKINNVETQVFDATLIPDASTTAKGYFTPSGFNKLAGIAENATNVSKSDTNGNILINGVETLVYTPSGTSEEAETAKKLSTPRAFSVTGDVTAPAVNFDGTANVVLNAELKTLANIGTGVKPTVNEKGLVTKLNALAVNDIPDLPNTKITGLGTASTKDVGTNAGDVVMLGSNGLINIDLIPPMDITKVYEANSESAMLALDATVGSVCVRTDVAETYILRAEPATVLANWIKLPHPSDAVTSVNGQIGAVNLTTSNIGEGTNQYFTTARATANFNANIRTTASTLLTDGATLVHNDDLATADSNGLLSNEDYTKLQGISKGATKVTDSTVVGNILVDGTEVPVFNLSNIPDASTTAKGLMIPAQTTKLAGIASNATKVSASETAGHILINDVDTTVFEVSDIPDASTTTNGVMTSAMVTKLASIANGATKVADSDTVGHIMINDVDTTVFELSDIPNASTTDNGLLTSQGFTKLNGITANATKTEASSTVGNIKINGAEVKVFNTSDIPDASTTVKGLMGTAMVTKLNGIATGATKVESSTTAGNIKINGTETKVFNVSDIPVASNSQNGLLSTANKQFLDLVNGFYTSTTTKPTVLHVNTRSTATTNNTGSIYQPFTTIASAVAYAVAQGITGYYIVVDDGNVVTDTELTILTGCNALITHNAPVNITQATFNLGNTRLIADIVGVTNTNCTIKSEIKTFKMVVSGNVVIGEGGNLFVDEFVGAQTTTFTVGIADETNAPFINILQGQNIDWGSQITLVKTPSLGSRLGYLYYGLTAQS